MVLDIVILGQFLMKILNPNTDSELYAAVGDGK